MKQGPDLYLEPKWLRCWHYLRCTRQSTVSMKKCWSKSHIIIKTTDYLPCWFGEKPRHGCNAAAGLCCIDQAAVSRQKLHRVRKELWGQLRPEHIIFHLATVPAVCQLLLNRNYTRSGRNHGASLGLEPTIPGSVGRCLIHWATGPVLDRSRKHVISHLAAMLDSYQVTRALPALPSCCHLETDCAHVAVNMLPRQLQQESIYWQHSVRLT